jgi:hypothetical protein
MLLCASSWAQQTNIVSTASPKLKKFISAHPEAAKIFTNAISNAFSNKTVRLYYFYSDDESEARAFHYYPNNVGLPEVVLCVRENQNPLDEFITILFETQNSKNESKFAKIYQDAYSGTLSREQFASEISQYEFEATKSTHALLLALKFGKNEIDESYYYKRFAGCPTNYNDFLSYCKKVSPQRDALKEDELQYDSLQKIYNDSYSPSNSPVKN